MQMLGEFKLPHFFNYPPYFTFVQDLSHGAREAFLSALVFKGRAEWLDKSHRKCLILWHRIQDWADLIINFVKDNGLEDSVMTVEEVHSGVESRGTELHGMDLHYFNASPETPRTQGEACNLQRYFCGR